MTGEGKAGRGRLRAGIACSFARGESRARGMRRDAAGKGRKRKARAQPAPKHLKLFETDRKDRKGRCGSLNARKSHFLRENISTKARKRRKKTSEVSREAT